MSILYHTECMCGNLNTIPERTHTHNARTNFDVSLYERIVYWYVGCTRLVVYLHAISTYVLCVYSSISRDYGHKC